MFTHKMLRGNLSTYVTKCLYGAVFLTVFISMLDINRALQAVFDNPAKPKKITYSIPLAIEVTENSYHKYERKVSRLSEKLVRAYDVPEDFSQNVADWILVATVHSGVPTQLLASVIMTESSYNPASVSRVGAVGLGQIRMKFWRNECPYADLDSGENIKCTALILRHYYNTYCNEDWICALKAYNLGPSNFNKKRFVAAGNRYVTKILRNIALFKGQTTTPQNIELAANLLYDQNSQRIGL